LQIGGRGPYKSYVALFVCFAPNANFLEIVSDQSTRSFLLAFQIGRRGCPQTGNCNNAMKSVGASELWEVGVKTAKHLILRAVSSAFLRAVELGTVIVGIETELNSRPLGALSKDPRDGEALTPEHPVYSDFSKAFDSVFYYLLVILIY